MGEEKRRRRRPGCPPRRQTWPARDAGGLAGHGQQVGPWPLYRESGREKGGEREFEREREIDRFRGRES